MKEPILTCGERVIMKEQGSYDAGLLSSSWRLGHLCLTNKRLLFVQGAKTHFEINIDKITDMGVEKRRWVIGKMIEQLRLTYKPGRRLYIAVKKPKKWELAIKDRITRGLINSLR